MECKGEGPLGAPLLEPAHWILGLYNTWIMNLLNIPHFGLDKHINRCVKQFLARVHGGFLWMDRSVPINVYLIETITGIPMDGENLDQYFKDKTKVKAISYEIKEKYGMDSGNRGIKISDINDRTTIFSTRLLGLKLMHKCMKEELPK
jgi:hypothetical protein